LKGGDNVSDLKRTLSIYIAETDYEKLQIRAEKDGRSVSQYTRILIEKHLQEPDKQLNLFY